MQYGVQESGNTQIMNISGGSTSQANITELISATIYTIQVAAVNNAGIGIKYSSPISTSGKV